MSLDLSFWLFTAIFVAGLALFLNVVLRELVGFLYYWLRFRFLRGRRAQAASVVSEADLIRDRVRALRSADSIPSWGILLAAMASLLVFSFTSSPWSAGFVLIYLMGSGWYRGYLRRREGKDVWWFLLDLRTRLTLTGSLMPALIQVAKKGDTRAAKIVGLYLASGQMMSGVDLLARIAADTKLPYLSELVSRTQAAAAGSLGIDDAMRQTIDAIGREVNVRTREQLQSVPSRLTLFVFPLLLGPSLVILLYPVVARLILGIAGDPSSLGAP